MWTIRRVTHALKQQYQWRPLLHHRRVATAAQKSEGTIADAFASMSGLAADPLDVRFAKIKHDLISGNEDAVQASWSNLLDKLATETERIATDGSAIIPQIDFQDIASPSTAFDRQYRQRGAAVIRGVVPVDEALQMKTDLREYIKANPHTKAFPAGDPQVYELYWSPSQVRARSHPNMIATQRFLLDYWHSNDPSRPSCSEPIVYADRLRLRQPGDASFALGPHIDGGGPERWEPNGYGLDDSPYKSIFSGQWPSYDPWDSSRQDVNSDLYYSPNACSVFRTNQGWLSMSASGPGEGHLQVYPLLREATAYFLLRPFFSPIHSPSSSFPIPESLFSDPAYLSPSDWRLDKPCTPVLQGAIPGRAQELSPALHPHLRLDKAMTPVPSVQPGDYVAWHCDTIHAVDPVHRGESDSSVMYIPAAPLTTGNAKYLARQREAWRRGWPAPDFPVGEGEARHSGRGTEGHVLCEEGKRAFGLQAWRVDDGLQGQMMQEVNRVLGF